MLRFLRDTGITAKKLFLGYAQSPEDAIKNRENDAAEDAKEEFDDFISSTHYGTPASWYLEKLNEMKQTTLERYGEQFYQILSTYKNHLTLLRRGIKPTLKQGEQIFLDCIKSASSYGWSSPYRTKYDYDYDYDDAKTVESEMKLLMKLGITINDPKVVRKVFRRLLKLRGLSSPMPYLVLHYLIDGGCPGLFANENIETLKSIFDEGLGQQ